MKRTGFRKVFAVLLILAMALGTLASVSAATSDRCRASSDGKHHFGKWKTVEKGDCQTHSVEARTCKYCGVRETREGKKGSHSYGSWHTSKQATCTEDGKQTRTCKICGHKDNRAIEKTGHSWGSWRTTVEATCTRKGEQKRTCSACGASQTRTVDRADHSWGAWQTVREATCTRGGEEKCTCSVCGNEQTRETDKKPHAWSEWTVVVEPTDHSVGTRTQTCKVCGTEKPEDFDPEGTLRRGDSGEAVKKLQEGLICYGVLTDKVDGSFGKGTEAAVSAVQEAEGFHVDGVAWPQTQAVLGHRFGEWETVQEMSDFSTGIRRRVCARCGYEETEEEWPEPTYKKGDKGDDVKALQQGLNDAGYDCGEADGDFGKKTEAAVKDIEADHGVEADGIAWPGVQKWLGVNSAPGISLRNLPVGGKTLILVVEQVSPKYAFYKLGDPITFQWSLVNLADEPVNYGVMYTGSFMESFDPNGDQFLHGNTTIEIGNTDLEPFGATTASGEFTSNLLTEDVEGGVARMYIGAKCFGVKDGEYVPCMSNVVPFEFPLAPEGIDTTPQVDGPGLALEVLDVEKSAYDAGDRVRATLRLTNIGTVELHRLELFPEYGDEIEGEGWENTGYYYAVTHLDPLAPGRSLELTYTLVIDGSKSGWKDRVIDACGSSVDSYYRRDAWASVTINVPAKPAGVTIVRGDESLEINGKGEPGQELELIPTEATMAGPGLCVDGDSVPLAFTIKNPGPRDALVARLVYRYYRKDGTLAHEFLGGEVSLGSGYNSDGAAILAGDSEEYSLTLPARSDNNTAGNYVIKMLVRAAWKFDSNHGVLESNEVEISYRCAENRKNEQYELSLTYPSAKAYYLPGETVTAYLTVRNNAKLPVAYKDMTLPAGGVWDITPVDPNAAKLIQPGEVYVLRARHTVTEEEAPLGTGAATFQATGRPYGNPNAVVLSNAVDAVYHTASEPAEQAIELTAIRTGTDVSAGTFDVLLTIDNPLEAGLTRYEIYRCVADGTLLGGEPAVMGGLIPGGLTLDAPLTYPLPETDEVIYWRAVGWIADGIPVVSNVAGVTVEASPSDEPLWSLDLDVDLLNPKDDADAVWHHEEEVRFAISAAYSGPDAPAFIECYVSDPLDTEAPDTACSFAYGATLTDEIARNLDAYSQADGACTLIFDAIAFDEEGGVLAISEQIPFTFQMDMGSGAGIIPHKLPIGGKTLLLTVEQTTPEREAYDLNEKIAFSWTLTNLADEPVDFIALYAGDDPGCFDTDEPGFMNGVSAVAHDGAMLEPFGGSTSGTFEAPLLYRFVDNGTAHLYFGARCTGAQDGETVDCMSNVVPYDFLLTVNGKVPPRVEGPGLDLKVADVEKSQYDPGDRVTARLELTNIGTETLRRLELFPAQGDEILGDGWENAAHGLGAVHMGPLEPGDSLEVTYTLVIDGTKSGWNNRAVDACGSVTVDGYDRGAWASATIKVPVKPSSVTIIQGDDSIEINGKGASGQKLELIPADSMLIGGGTRLDGDPMSLTFYVKNRGPHDAQAVRLVYRYYRKDGTLLTEFLTGSRALSDAGTPTGTTVYAPGAPEFTVSLPARADKGTAGGYTIKLLARGSWSENGECGVLESNEIEFPYSIIETRKNERYELTVGYANPRPYYFQGDSVTLYLSVRNNAKQAVAYKDMTVVEGSGWTFEPVDPDASKLLEPGESYVVRAEHAVTADEAAKGEVIHVFQAVGRPYGRNEAVLSNEEKAVFHGAVKENMQEIELTAKLGTTNPYTGTFDALLTVTAPEGVYLMSYEIYRCEENGLLLDGVPVYEGGKLSNGESHGEPVAFNLPEEASETFYWRAVGWVQKSIPVESTVAELTIDPLSPDVVAPEGTLELHVDLLNPKDDPTAKWHHEEEVLVNFYAVYNGPDTPESIICLVNDAVDTETPDVLGSIYNTEALSDELALHLNAYHQVDGECTFTFTAYAEHVGGGLPTISVPVTLTFPMDMGGAGIIEPEPAPSKSPSGIMSGGVAPDVDGDAPAETFGSTVTPDIDEIVAYEGDTMLQILLKFLRTLVGILNL